jgi:hypothetical protein
MSLQSDEVLVVAKTTSGLGGWTQAQLSSEVAALVGAPSNVFCRGTFAAPTGAPNSLESCNLTITVDQSGFSVASSSQLRLPSTGYYLLLVQATGITTAIALADVNTAVAVPNLTFTLTQFGAGTIGSMANPLIYRVTAAADVDAYCAPGGAAMGVGNVANIATQYFRIDYINRVTQTGNTVGSGSFVCLKLRS